MIQILELCNWLCLMGVLGIAVWQDVTTHKIKNAVNVTGMILGILFAVVLPEREVLWALIGFFAMFILGLGCWNLKFFTAGDAKLLCVIGTFLEWKMGVNILLIAIICGAVLGAPFVIWKWIKKEKGLTKIPFSISIAIASILGICFGYIWEWISFM